MHIERRENHRIIELLTVLYHAACTDLRWMSTDGIFVVIDVCESSS